MPHMYICTYRHKYVHVLVVLKHPFMILLLVRIKRLVVFFDYRFRISQCWNLLLCEYYSCSKIMNIFRKFSSLSISPLVSLIFVSMINALWLCNERGNFFLSKLFYVANEIFTCGKCGLRLYRKLEHWVICKFFGILQESNNFLAHELQLWSWALLTPQNCNGKSVEFMRLLVSDQRTVISLWDCCLRLPKCSNPFP